MEMAFERRLPARRAHPWWDALEGGAWHGAWTVTLGSVPAGLAYVARWGSLPLPWTVLGGQLATFVAVSGALYGGAIALGQAIAEDVADRSTFAIALPAALGALAGLAPGAFAAEHFGRVSAPYFGTIEIVVAALPPFFLLGAALLRRAGSRGGRALRALLRSLCAPAVFALAVWALVPDGAWIVDTAVLRGADRAPHLALFGAALGALLGALYGAQIGLAKAILARRDRALSAGGLPRGSA